jgi:hypothetical protein
VSYQEHDKCRGCGANVWGIDPAGRDLTWKAMHNEANCLAGKLDSSEKIVEAYGHAMIALREAIGIDAYAEHEDTIETIRRIRGRENTLDVRVQELECRLGAAVEVLERIRDGAAITPVSPRALAADALKQLVVETSVPKSPVGDFFRKLGE